METASLTWGLAYLYLRHHAWEPMYLDLAGCMLLKMDLITSQGLSRTLDDAVERRLPV